MFNVTLIRGVLTKNIEFEFFTSDGDASGMCRNIH